MSTADNSFCKHGDVWKRTTEATRDQICRAIKVGGPEVEALIAAAVYRSAPMTLAEEEAHAERIIEAASREARKQAYEIPTELETSSVPQYLPSRPPSPQCQLVSLFFQWLEASGRMELGGLQQQQQATQRPCTTPEATPSVEQ